MSNEIKLVKNWWLLSIAGILLTLLGIWVFKNPVENYIGLSILFSVVLFISGIFEITFALSNTKVIKGWGWLLSSGVFDLIIGLILISSENITMAVLPFIFGVWLIFRGIVQINRGFLLKEAHFTNWGWSVFGGIVIVIFGFMVVYNPTFGSASIIVWTCLIINIFRYFYNHIFFYYKKITTLS